MDSCQQIYQRTTSNIIANLIQLRNSSTKREKLALALESHLSNGTFPSNLNFNVAHFQFPAATTEEEKEELIKAEAELLHQFKLDLLTKRLNLSKIIYNRLSDQLSLESQRSTIKKRILEQIPTLTNKPNILNDLIFTIDTQYGAFIAKQSLALASAKPAEPRTNEPSSSTPEMLFIRKELAAIRNMVEKRDSLPNRQPPLNQQDPRAHRRGSDATTDGSQDRRFQKNRQSPYRREKAHSNSNPNSRSQSPSARIQKSRSEKDLGNQEKGSRHPPENQHRHQPGNQQRRQNSTPYRPKKN
jgi:hypothetical protein